jgi:hypothetical protein
MACPGSGENRGGDPRYVWRFDSARPIREGRGKPVPKDGEQTGIISASALLPRLLGVSRTLWHPGATC